MQSEFEIDFDEKFKRFYVKGTNQIMRGLHKVLAARFYPEGSTYENVKRGSFQTKSGKQLFATKGRKPIKTARRAKNLGIRVDTQMAVLVEAAKGDAIILRAWIQGGKTLASFVRSGKIPPRPLKRMEPETSAGILKMLDNGLIPVACQMTVGSVTHNIATRHDVVCQRATKTKRPTIVQTKVGYDRSWKSGTGKNLNKPLDMLPDTAENKAHLQTAAEVLLHKDYKGVVPDAFVLRISSRSVTLDPLLPIMQKSLNAIGKQLVSND